MMFIVWGLALFVVIFIIVLVALKKQRYKNYWYWCRTPVEVQNKKLIWTSLIVAHQMKKYIIIVWWLMYTYIENKTSIEKTICLLVLYWLVSKKCYNKAH